MTDLLNLETEIQDIAIVQTVEEDDTTHSPSGDAVYNYVEGELPRDVSDLTDTQDTEFTPKSHDHEISDLENISTVSVTITYVDTTTETKNFVIYTPPSNGG